MCTLGLVDTNTNTNKGLLRGRAMAMAACHIACQKSFYKTSAARDEKLPSKAPNGENGGRGKIGEEVRLIFHSLDITKTRAHVQ